MLLIPYLNAISWEHYGTIPIAIVALLTIIITYISTNIWNNYRHLADRYTEILQLGIHNPNLINPKQTRNYTKVWELGTPERYTYDVYAWLCWEHAYHLYSLPLPFLGFFCRKHFLKRYANTLETYNRLHKNWLENNNSFFPNKKFLHFIEKRKWRDYFNSRLADELRWNYEVDNYDELILHPLLVKENNPMLNYIDKNKEQEYIVVDIGCGNGKFVEKMALTTKFKIIYGIDYSDYMIEIARDRSKFFKNVRIRKMNMKNLSKLNDELKNEKFDIVFSLNSILPRDPYDTELMFQEIGKILKPSGRFVAILPSFDTVEHLKKLEFQKFKKIRGKNYKIFSSLIAWFDTWRLFHKERKMNTKKRLYADDHVNVQRFIHETDIKSLLDKAGLTLLEQEKLYYPWELTQKFNYGHFPDEEKIWDWFIVAHLK